MLFSFAVDESREIEEEYAKTIALNIAHEFLRRQKTDKNLIIEDERGAAEMADASKETTEKGAKEEGERSDGLIKEKEVVADEEDEDKHEAEVISDLEVTDSNRMFEVGTLI